MAPNSLVKIPSTKPTRCILKIGHGGSHLFVRTTESRVLLGECSAKDEAR